MILYIKNMVCGRCEIAVKLEFEQLKLPIFSLKLGEVEIARDLIENERQTLAYNLKLLGFELLEDKSSKIIEQIKNRIIELVHYQNDKLKVNLSNYLSANLAQDYSSLSKLFSDVEGITIEHYFIAQKIEKAKELLVYDELSISQIAIDLNYSSVAHLSKQFKKVTGFTPTQFKNEKSGCRNALDKL
ncbi:helix-turn-helix domain-containing protein [Flavobacterium cellulosilyticum]|uniref:AraC family transcriptional regulator n=1 Tax=Flavobacterium cellulosilyticum TaxID=2541731 RepID=A0A4R5CDS3_9FLAO|nr:AraC family transcriptional regulator [Flavobacterium cellulosilyticum]TDD97089.1 AraC family transcriptional regulator [Flavobacterium cellulosilyticum]